MAAGVERLAPRLWRATDRVGRVYRVRPIAPADAPALQRAFLAQDRQDRVMRLLSVIPRLPDRMALKFASVDPARDVCLVFEPEDAPGTLAGGARLMRDATGDAAEFAVTVASPLKGRGLGRMALETVFGIGAEMGIARAWGLISRRNAAMRALAARLGMRERPDPDDPSLVIADKDLAPPPAQSG